MKKAVQLEKITKSYTPHGDKSIFFDKLRSKKKKHIALNSLSLTIKKGEKIGIIGSNGSGKTTLLKIISGITVPDTGKLYTKGKIVPLIDLKVGFQPDLKAIENIYINGLLIGMKKKQVNQKLQTILDFAELGKYIHEPLYTFSQGMKLRLGFSIAINSFPDILLLDEVISVGDEYFQEKTGQKIEEMFRKKKTIIIVSHSYYFLKKHCNRIVWIENGQIVKDGGLEILEEYVAQAKDRIFDSGKKI